MKLFRSRFFSRFLSETLNFWTYFLTFIICISCVSIPLWGMTCRRKLFILERFIWMNIYMDYLNVIKSNLKLPIILQKIVKFHLKKKNQFSSLILINCWMNFICFFVWSYPVAASRQNKLKLESYQIYYSTSYNIIF